MSPSALVVDGISSKSMPKETPRIRERGVTVYGRLHCTYGSRVEVSESLAARGHLWLRMEAGSGALWYLDAGQGAAHLSVDQAKKLRDVLDAGIAESERMWGA